MTPPVLKKSRMIGACALSGLFWAHAQCAGVVMPGKNAPTPADPYPLNAAGWGPEAGNGLMVSRWAEDWTGLRAAGQAPPLKAIPLGGEAFLTLSAEARLRYDAYAYRTGLNNTSRAVFPISSKCRSSSPMLGKCPSENRRDKP